MLQQKYGTPELLEWSFFTNCNCSWSDIFPNWSGLLSRVQAWRMQIVWVRTVNCEIWIPLHFLWCISASFYWTVSLQAVPCASIKIFFEKLRKLWPSSGVWDREFDSGWTGGRMKLGERSVYYSTFMQAKYLEFLFSENTSLICSNWELHGWARYRKFPGVINPARFCQFTYVAICSGTLII